MKSLDSANFKINGSTECPVDQDYDILGFHKKRTIVKGELVKIEYYRNFDGTTYSDLIIEENRTFYRDENSGLAIYRNLNIKWFMDDESVGYEKNATKFYSLVEAIDEGISRRNNMIAAAKLVVLGAVGLVNGQDLMVSVANEISLFSNGTTQPLRDAVNNSTKPYLNSTIKALIVTELTF